MLYVHKMLPSSHFKDGKARFAIVDTDDCTATFVTFDEIEAMLIGKGNRLLLDIKGVTTSRNTSSGQLELTGVAEWRRPGRLSDNQILKFV